MLGINLCSFYPVSVSIRFCFSVSLWGSAFRVIWIRAASCNGQRRASSRRGVRVRVARHDPACGMAHASHAGGQIVSCLSLSFVGFTIYKR